MIPSRRPRLRRASEIEITDDDIIEVKPQPRSGLYPAVQLPPVRSESDDVNVSLARLSLADKSASTLRLLGAIELNDLSPEHAWVVSLVTAGFDLQAVIMNSPRSEEDTLALLRRLVEMRIIALVPAR